MDLILRLQFGLLQTCGVSKDRPHAAKQLIHAKAQVNMAGACGAQGEGKIGQVSFSSKSQKEICENNKTKKILYTTSCLSRIV